MKAKKSGKSRTSTRERIVQRSITLFNTKGVRNVAIDSIAADLKISPGNLTYHFPRKRDLIAAALGVMKSRLREALEPPTGVRSARDGAEYLVRLFATLWDFRFFFNGLTYVLADSGLRREYREFHRWALDTIHRDILVLHDHGYFLTPVIPNSFALLTENIWSLWLSWLRKEQIAHPEALTPANPALYDCALHVWSLCQPWMRLDYARELLQCFEELLPRGKARPAGNV